jgi:hypothetical protein
MLSNILESRFWSALNPTNTVPWSSTLPYGILRRKIFRRGALRDEESEYCIECGSGQAVLVWDKRRDACANTAGLHSVNLTLQMADFALLLSAARADWSKNELSAAGARQVPGIDCCPTVIYLHEYGTLPGLTGLGGLALISALPATCWRWSDRQFALPWQAQ